MADHYHMCRRLTVLALYTCSGVAVVAYDVRVRRDVHLGAVRRRWTVQ